MNTKTFSEFEQPYFSDNSSKLIDIIFDAETNKDYFVLGYFNLVDTSSRKGQLKTVWLDLDGTTKINRNYPAMGTINGSLNSCVAIDRKNNLIYLVSSTSNSTNATVKVWVRNINDTTSNWEEVCTAPSIYNYSYGLDIRNMVYSEETNSLYYACRGDSSSSETRIIKVDITNKVGTEIGVINGTSADTSFKLIVFEDGDDVYLSTGIGSVLFNCIYQKNEVGDMISASYEVNRSGNTTLFQLDKYNCLNMLSTNKSIVYECFTGMIVGQGALYSQSNNTLYCTAMYKGNYLLDSFYYINQKYPILCIDQVTGEFKYFQSPVLHSQLVQNAGTSYYISSDILYEATNFTLVFSNGNNNLLIV